MSSETYRFFDDVPKFIDLLITSNLNKELFLREFISNASDALDKLRYQFLSLRFQMGEPDYRIRIIPDKVNNTLTILDTGIGMTKFELVSNLGAIYRGQKRMIREILASGADISAFGRFNLGFFSAFLVADKVTVISKSVDDYMQYKWESTGGGTFTVSEDEQNPEQLTRGTKVILHLRDDSLEFLNEEKIRDMTIRKPIQWVPYTFELQVEKISEKQVNDNENKKEEEKGKDDKKNIKEVTYEWECLNKPLPIWMKNPENVSREEYATFYKSLTNDNEDYFAMKHFSVEGQLEFKGILFIPKITPSDMCEIKKRGKIHLYVRKLSIMDDCQELIPGYLNFVSGVVDSEDLPLNISREFLNQNKILKVMRKNIARKMLELIQEISENNEDYKKFYEHYSINIKLGLQEETNLTRPRLIELLRFYTSKSGDDQISLKQYVNGMKEGQKEIFFITGESKAAVANSPLVEPLKKKGYEVIYMLDPSDEYVIKYLSEYEGKKLRDWTKEGAAKDINEEKRKFEEQEIVHEKLCKLIKEVLGDKIEKVQVGTRISDFPCVLVSSRSGWLETMEKIMKPQAAGDNNSLTNSISKKIMEINLDHPIIDELMKKISLDVSDKGIKDLIWLLFEQGSSI